jgi:murein L,D-transpeptidase YcbB/YkuD
VDWSDASETSEISLRQRPGPGNALGNIKFLLPNRNNVYLHDTPTHNLFARMGGR